MNPRLLPPSNRGLACLCRTLIGGVSSFCRGYYASRTRKPTLYSKISPLGNPGTTVTPQLDDWVRSGNRVRFAELQRIIKDLRKRKRFNQALEVSLWMQKEGLFTFTPTEQAVQLDLIGRVDGFDSAEKYFDNLKDEDKTEKTYGALLNCYTRQLQLDKSLSHFQKMKEMDFASSALTYNDIMCLYTNMGQHEKVPALLADMKDNGVSPDNFSYRICINSFGVRSDIEGMEKILKEIETQPHIVVDWNTYSMAANFYIKAGLTKKALDALKRAEDRLDKKDGLGYNHLISLHASLGNKSEILRLWRLEKEACKRCINRDYITVLKSLVRISEFEDAEKIIKDWESSGNFYDIRIPNTIIVGYIEKGLHEKAEALLEGLMKNGQSTSPDIWARLASGYLERQDHERAVNSMKISLSLCHSKAVRRWKPNPKVARATLDWLGNNGSYEYVEGYVDLLRSVVGMDIKTYHTLLKAGLRNGKEVRSVLDRMKADGIEEDEETKQIISMGWGITIESRCSSVADQHQIGSTICWPD